MKVRRTLFDSIYQFCVEFYLALILIIIVVPLWRIIMQSITPIAYRGSNLGAMVLPPWDWSFKAYTTMLGHGGFTNALKNSLIILSAGVTTSLFMTIPLAYVMAAKRFPGKKLLNLIVLIPFLFHAGLIPHFLVVRGLGMIDTFFAVFVPGAISVYNTFVMRSFFQGIPEELKESARIDGAGELKILVRIIMPLSKSILLTIGLFYAVYLWNDFFNPLVYLNKSSMAPLPIFLRNILMAASMNEYVEATAFAEASIQSIRAAAVILTSLPMVVAYPFIQKYFTKGTLLGSVKG